MHERPVPALTQPKRVHSSGSCGKLRIGPVRPAARSVPYDVSSSPSPKICVRRLVGKAGIQTMSFRTPIYRVWQSVCSGDGGGAASTRRPWSLLLEKTKERMYEGDPSHVGRLPLHCTGPSP